MDFPGVNGIADLSRERVRLRVTGEDRVAFLHGQCTNDIRRLRLGDSCYAAFPNAKGKMRGDGYIVCLDDALLVEANRELKDSLERFVVTEDVAIEDVSEALGEWLVVGRGNVPWAAGATTFAHLLGTGVLTATPMTATLSRDDLEVIRVEAGVPWWGVDMNEDTIPVEAGLGLRAISYEKGCYIGQETIARIRTYGHVNRQLVQIAMAVQAGPAPRSDGRPPPPGQSVGEKVFAGDREVGWVTSALDSVRLGKRLALGYVRREFAQTGAKLTINQQTAEVLKTCDV